MTFYFWGASFGIGESRIDLQNPSFLGVLFFLGKPWESDLYAYAHFHL